MKQIRENALEMLQDITEEYKKQSLTAKHPMTRIVWTKAYRRALDRRVKLISYVLRKDLKEIL